MRLVELLTEKDSNMRGLLKEALAELSSLRPSYGSGPRAIDSLLVRMREALGEEDAPI